MGWERDYGIDFEAVQKKLRRHPYLYKQYRVLERLGYPKAKEKLGSVELETSAYDRHRELKFIQSLEDQHDRSISAQVTQTYLAKFYRVQAWENQTRPVRTLLNLFPWMKSFHCWGCGTIHLIQHEMNYCRCCQAQLQALTRARSSGLMYRIFLSVRTE